DEPASVLLERIRLQKQQMVKEGKLKPKDIKNDTIIFVGEDSLHYEKFPDGSVKCIEEEIPFELPEGWVWSKIGPLCEYITSGSRGWAQYYSESGSLFLRMGNLSRDSFDLRLDSLQRVNLPDNAEGTRTRVAENDLLFSITAEIGMLGLIPANFEEAYINQHVGLIRFLKDAQTKYFPYILMSEFCRDQYYTVQSGMKNSFRLDNIQNIFVPVPPLGEQIRLAEKLSSIWTHIQQIDNERETTTDIISKTKSKILDLAIRGQLVPQNPDDEPASVLLERIRAEKEKMIHLGKIKRDKRESIIFRGEDNSYYLRTGEMVESLEDWAFEDLPDSWSVCCLGELCDYGNCTNVDTIDIADSAWMLDLEDIEKDSGVVLQKVRKAERNAASTKHRFHKGQVLYSKLRPYLNKVVLADEDGYCTSEILPLEFERNILPQYARYYLMSPAFLRYANKCSYGVKMPRLGTADGKKAIISIPPIKEQERIVKHIRAIFEYLNMISDTLS
ncbi:MAG TPA: restriction endonuclease subunit S, partial [Methanocorpusculum sp.]|nr:restriction endonuclease subunit S [Methanocorpusculum sp.]